MISTFKTYIYNILILNKKISCNQILITNIANLIKNHIDNNNPELIDKNLEAGSIAGSRPAYCT